MTGMSVAAVTTSPDGIWQLLEGADRDAYLATHSRDQTWVVPTEFKLAILNDEALRAALKDAPLERLDLPRADRPKPRRITLPMPDGSFKTFLFVESPVLATELQARYPEIRTYAGYGENDPAYRVRFDRTMAGFHSQVLSPDGRVYIDPHIRMGDAYAVYTREHAMPREQS